MRKWSRVALWREARCGECGSLCRVAGSANDQNWTRLSMAVLSAVVFVMFGFASFLLLLPMLLILPFRILGVERADEA